MTSGRCPTSIGTGVRYPPEYANIRQFSEQAQLCCGPTLRRVDETHLGLIQSASSHTRNAAVQLFGDFRVAHRAEQRLLRWCPLTGTFPTLTDAECMPFQLNCVSRPPEHPGYHGVRSLAEELNLAPCPTASLWSKNRDAQRFTFPRYRGRATSHQFCQFFVANSPKQAQFVVGPSFPV